MSGNKQSRYHYRI